MVRGSEDVAAAAFEIGVLRADEHLRQVPSGRLRPRPIHLIDDLIQDLLRRTGRIRQEPPAERDVDFDARVHDRPHVVLAGVAAEIAQARQVAGRPLRIRQEPPQTFPPLGRIDPEASRGPEVAVQ